MNREELRQAIEWLRKEEAWRKGHEPTDYIGTALAALREQQVRENGCDYCGLIYKLDGASYGTDSVIIENRFCPMCGKRLEVHNE